MKQTTTTQNTQLEKLVKQMAELSMGPDLRAWIEANTTFPNTMVDRITPATGPRERDMARVLGLDDPVPVTCEPFRHWCQHKPGSVAAGRETAPDDRRPQTWLGARCARRASRWRSRRSGSPRSR